MMTKRGPGGVGKVGQLGQSDLVSTLAAAIKRMEGWAPGSVSYRNNNPGNLRTIPGGWPGQSRNPDGSPITDRGGYAIFDSVASGEAALERQITTNISRGLTLEEFFAGKPGVYAGYAPAADRNQPNVYAANVATWTGIDPTVPLVSLVGSAGAPVISDVIDAGSETPPEGEPVSGGDISPMVIGFVALGAALAWLAFSRS